MGTRGRRVVAACSMAAVVWGSGTLHAQPLPEGGARRQLIEQGVQARDAGDHARAVELFTQAGRIEMRPGLRTSLAQEYEALGRHREACEMASRGVDEARADLSRPENGRALQGSAEVAATACRLVGLLHLRLPADALRGLQMIVQGRAVEATGEMVVVAVDPGVAVVQAVAADGRTFRQDVTVRAGETGELVVALQGAPAAAVPAPVAAAPAAPGAVPIADTAPVTVAAGHRGGAGAGPWIVGGVGVLAFGLAGVFYGVLRAGALSDRDAACHAATMSCDPAALDAQSRAETATLLTNVALGVGSAAVVGGVVWYLLGRGGSEEPERTAWTWGMGPLAGGAVLRVGGTL